MRTPMIESLVSYVPAGTHIIAAKADAIKLAVEHECDVTFKHNDRIFKVAYIPLMESIQQQPPSGGAEQK